MTQDQQFAAIVVFGFLAIWIGLSLFVWWFCGRDGMPKDRP